MSESLCLQNGSRKLWNEQKCCPFWRHCDAFGCHFRDLGCLETGSYLVGSRNNYRRHPKSGPRLPNGRQLGYQGRKDPAVRFRSGRSMDLHRFIRTSMDLDGFKCIYVNLFGFEWMYVDYIDLSGCLSFFIDFARISMIQGLPSSVMAWLAGRMVAGWLAS